MKKKIQSILILLFSQMSFSALATEITVINQSPKASVMTGMAVMAQNTIGDAEFYQSRDCRDAALIYQKNVNAVIIYETMNVASAAAKKINCEIDFAPNDVVLSTVQHFQFCQLPDQKSSIRDMHRLGMAGMHPYKKWVSELNTSNDLDVKVQVYQGSEATLRGLISREIDFGFLADATAEKAKQQGLIRCDYSTNPETKNFIGSHIKHPIPDIAIRVFILTRSDHGVIRERLRGGDFRRYLERSGYTVFNDDFSALDLSLYRHQFQLLKSFY